MRGWLLAVFSSLLYRTLMSLSVSASLLPLTSSAFSIAIRLCVALPPLLVSVSVAVVVLARLLVWFGVADVFAGNRGRRWWRAGFRFGLRAFVFVWVIPSSLWGTVLVVLRWWGRIVGVVTSFLLFLLYVGAVFLRRGLSGTFMVSSAARVVASSLCVRSGAVAVGSEEERWRQNSVFADDAI